MYNCSLGNISPHALLEVRNFFGDANNVLNFRMSGENYNEIYKVTEHGELSYFMALDSLSTVLGNLKKDKEENKALEHVFNKIKLHSNSLPKQQGRMLEMMFKVTPFNQRAFPTTPHVHPDEFGGPTISLGIGQGTVIFDEPCTIKRGSRNHEDLDFKCLVKTLAIPLPDGVICQFDSSITPHQGPDDWFSYNQTPSQRLSRVLITVSYWPIEEVRLLHPRSSLWLSSKQEL